VESHAEQAVGDFAYHHAATGELKRVKRLEPGEPSFKLFSPTIRVPFFPNDSTLARMFGKNEKGSSPWAEAASFLIWAQTM